MPRHALFLMVLAACGAPTTTDETARFDAGTFARLDLRVDVGDVTVRAGDSGVLTTTLAWRGDVRPDVSSRLAGGTLVAEATCPPDARGCRTDIEVTIPASVELDLDVLIGNVVLRGIDGDLDLVAQAGTIDVAKTGGFVRIDAPGGEVMLDDVAGRILVSSGAAAVDGTDLAAPTVDIRGDRGDVTLAFAAQPDLVEVQTTSGDVRLDVPRGEYDVDVTTDRGVEDVRELTNTSSAGSLLRVDTRSGDVIVRGF